MSSAGLLADVVMLGRGAGAGLSGDGLPSHDVTADGGAGPDVQATGVTSRPRRPWIAVVGAGWAGLAAATRLTQHGCDVTVFESGHTPGGRARRVAAPVPEGGVGTDDSAGFASDLDNGQHLLLGAYSETLKLMQTLGVSPETALLRTPLRLLSADGVFSMKAPGWLPAPLHVAVALVSARGLQWADKGAAFRLLRALQQWQFRLPSAVSTVTELLNATGQTDRVTNTLWRPLCLAALNTPLDEASAQLFAVVLRDSLATTRSDSDLLIPRVDLTALWPQAASERCTMRYGHTVRTVSWIDGRASNRPTAADDALSMSDDSVDAVEVDGLEFDQVIIAVPPTAAARLLSSLDGAPPLCNTLRAFRYLPIATLTLRLAGPYRLPSPMMLLFDTPENGRDGQWVFDRGALLGLASDQGELAIVISEASRLADRPREEAIASLIEQLRDQLAAHPGSWPALPDVVQTALIVEKRATFAAVPDLVRPGNRTPWPGVTLAGDYTNTGYPATLEGAVRSGLAAAESVLKRIETLRAAAGVTR